MFDEKQRVVWWKTTYRFIENNVSFVGLCRNGRNDEEKVRREVRKREEKWRRMWHLWQQKINIAVGRRARACVRRVCVWICTFSKKGRFRRRGAWETLFGFILFGSLFLWCFAHLRKQNKVYQKKIAQILADFSLFALVSTHLVLGGQCKRATTNRGIDKEKSKRKSRNTMQKDTMQKNDAKRNGAKRNRVRQTNLTHSVKIWKTNLSD